MPTHSRAAGKPAGSSTRRRGSVSLEPQRTGDATSATASLTTAEPRHEKTMAKKSKEGMRGLEHEGDPRGGRQSPEYRTADPRDLVVEGDTVMSGPAGAPQQRDPELRQREKRRKR